MIKITNLEKHYRKYRSPFAPHISNEVKAEHERVQQEEESTKRCFIICIRAIKYMDRLQSNLSEELFHNKIKNPQIDLASSEASYIVVRHFLDWSDIVA